MPSLPTLCFTAPRHERGRLSVADSADVYAEPVYRLAEKEWKDFIDAFTDVLVGADPQIPHLPPKDVIHRIYRDVSLRLPSLHPRAGTVAMDSGSTSPGFWRGSHSWSCDPRTQFIKAVLVSNGRWI